MIKKGDSVKVTDKETGEETNGIVDFSTKDILTLETGERFSKSKVQIVKN